jgi:hypothetical protein
MPVWALTGDRIELPALGQKIEALYGINCAKYSIHFWGFPGNPIPLKLIFSQKHIFGQ